MSLLYQTNLLVHATAGLCGLIVFWIPVLLKKGSPKHKQIGNWFIWAMMITGGTGLIMALLLYIDPIAARYPDNDFSPERLASVTESARTGANFFLVLGLLLLTSARQAKQVLVAKKDRKQLRKPVNLVLPAALLLAGIYLIGVAVSEQSVLFGAFAGLGVFVSVSILWYDFKPTIKRAEWIIEHLGGAFGAGIAAHTAFLVFGANRWIGELFVGQLQLIPWLAPSAIGSIAIVATTRFYRRKYGHNKNKQAKTQSISPQQTVGAD